MVHESGEEVWFTSQNLYALEVQDACKALRSKENVRDLVVERDSKLPLNMQPQKKSHTIVEEPQLEKWVEGSHVAIMPTVRWGNVK